MVFSRKKQAGWLIKCLSKYSTEVSRFISEILKKLKVIASVTLKKCENPLKIRQKRGPLNYVTFFVDLPRISNSIQEIHIP